MKGRNETGKKELKEGEGEARKCGKFFQKMWQFNELRKQINKQNQYFTKEIGTLKNNQTEILEITQNKRSRMN